MPPPERPSIARRIYLAMLLVSVLGMAVMVTVVSFISEDLEDTIVATELARERALFLADYNPDQPLVRDALGLLVAYVPTGQSLTLPTLFDGLSPPQSVELERDGQTWLITVDALATGALYLAKNITHFEDREALFERLLVGVALAIVAFSLLLAVASSRHLTRPLQSLSTRIADTPVGPNMPRIVTDYRDAELHAIADTFNRFLDELEAYVRREQSLLSLASHELRTPIAVFSGALDILASRGQLAENDRATLARARRACDEMRNNVHTLLALARRNSPPPQNTHCDIAQLVAQIAKDLQSHNPDAGRLSLVLDAPLVVHRDPAMVRMLLRNLMQNAIQHTRGDVHVRVNADAIDVTDQGAGLDAQAQAVLRGSHALAGNDIVGGLGLYIVTLMCERLGWKLDIVHTGGSGTDAIAHSMTAMMN